VVKRFSKKIAESLVCNGVVEEKEKAVYEYGFSIVFYNLINLGTMLLLSWLMGCIWESAIYAVCYIILRKFAGGYHAKGPITCYLVSTAMFFISIFLATHINIDFCYILIIIVLALFGSRIVPVDTENKSLSEKEKKVYRYIVIFVFSFEMLLCLVLFHFGLYVWCNSIVLAIICCEILVIIGYLYNKIRKEDC